MRSKVLNKKLSLNKATVANLTQTQMRLINGGAQSDEVGMQQRAVYEKDVDSTHTYHTCEPWTCTCNGNANAVAYQR